MADCIQVTSTTAEFLGSLCGSGEQDIVASDCNNEKHARLFDKNCIWADHQWSGRDCWGDWGKRGSSTLTFELFESEQSAELKAETQNVGCCCSEWLLHFSMAVNIPGLIAVIVFYIIIFLVGLLAARKKKSGDEAEGGEGEEDTKYGGKTSAFERSMEKGLTDDALETENRRLFSATL
eukprot:gene10374-19076_t